MATKNNRNGAPAPSLASPAPALPAAQPALAAALLAAQKAVKAVAHDAENSYHGYRYSSAEAILTECRAALLAAGLELVPLAQAVTACNGQFFLRRRFALVHADSGQERSITTTWPIIPDKGRPMDKAAASAATTSLSYLLRDLLLLPRVDRADDLGARDDRHFTPPAPPPASQAPAAIGDKGAARLARVATAKGLDLGRYLPSGKPAAGLTRDEANAVLAQLRKLPDLRPLPEREPAPAASGAPCNNGK